MSPSPPAPAESDFSRITKRMEAECKRLGLDLDGEWAVKAFRELRREERERSRKKAAERSGQPHGPDSSQSGRTVAHW